MSYLVQLHKNMSGSGLWKRARRSWIWRVFTNHFSIWSTAKFV